ncbi:MAG: hypothetical protein EXR60_07065 [Dehalococcoidia bacterium]|nr:hypothetical protein [Dehalococcoidia bacterium]
MGYFFRRHSPWLSALFIGLCLLAGGFFFVVKGLDAKELIKAALVAEQVRIGVDGVQFGALEGTLVADAKTADAQAKTIELHSTSIKGEVLKSGVPTILRYAEMKSALFVTPEAYASARSTYVTGLTLRTALNMAAMGFGLADMAVGAGLIVLIAGVATLGLAAPALYMLAGAVIPRPPPPVAGR